MTDRYQAPAPARPAESVLATNKVIRNTYMLLSMTLLFSAAMAGVSMVLQVPHPGVVITLVGYFGLLFLTTKFRDSTLGLGMVFALTGFMGYTLGPIVSHYLALPNGGQIVMTAMGLTGAIFLGLSGYALTSRKDFSFMGGFLMVGILVGFLAGAVGDFDNGISPGFTDTQDQGRARLGSGAGQFPLGKAAPDDVPGAGRREPTGAGRRHQNRRCLTFIRPGGCNRSISFICFALRGPLSAS